MSDKGRLLVATAVVAALVAILIAAIAVAQQGQGGPRGPARGRGVGSMMGPRMVGPMMGPRMMGMGPAMAPPPPEPVAICVEKGKVFVASGGRLYRFDAKTLEKEKEVVYAQPPEPPAVPGGPMPGAAPQPPPPAPQG